MNTDPLLPENTPEEIHRRQLDEARIKLEAMEFAYDANIRALHRWRTCLEMTTVVVAIGFLYIQYAIGDRTSTQHSIVSIVATGAALFVLLLVIWGHIANWTAQLEKKGEIAHALHQLIANYHKAELDAKKTQRCEDQRVDLEAQRKHRFASLRRRYLQYGYQHIAIKYPQKELKCTVCGRVWSPELAKRRKWTWVPFFGCDNCGV